MTASTTVRPVGPAVPDSEDNREICFEQGKACVYEPEMNRGSSSPNGRRSRGSAPPRGQDPHPPLARRNDGEPPRGRPSRVPGVAAPTAVGRAHTPMRQHGSVALTQRRILSCFGSNAKKSSKRWVASNGGRRRSTEKNRSSNCSGGTPTRTDRRIGQIRSTGWRRRWRVSTERSDRA